MSESKVVNPESEKIPISGDDWLLVKKCLSAGDQQDGFERSYLRNPDGSYVVGANGRLIVSPANTRLSMITSYLIDWSLVGLDGKPLDIRGASVAMVESMLRTLDADAFKEIYEAIDNYDTAQAMARAAKKKAATGAKGSSVISASPSAQDGDTSGSAN